MSTPSILHRAGDPKPLLVGNHLCLASSETVAQHLGQVKKLPPRILSSPKASRRNKLAFWSPNCGGHSIPLISKLTQTSVLYSNAFLTFSSPERNGQNWSGLYLAVLPPENDCFGVRPSFACNCGPGFSWLAATVARVSVCASSLMTMRCMDAARCGSGRVDRKEDSYYSYK